jgi:hypothetical protein
MGRIEEARALLQTASQAHPDHAAVRAALSDMKALQLGEAILAVQSRYRASMQPGAPASDFALPQALGRLVETLRQSLQEVAPTVCAVDVTAAIDEAHTSLAAAQACVCHAASQASPSAAEELRAAIAARDGARANLARSLRAAQAQLRLSLGAADVAGARASASELDQVLHAARRVIADEAAAKAARVCVVEAAGSLEASLAQLDD